MAGRLSLLAAGLAIAYGLLLFNLYHLQLANGQYYVARASEEYSAGGALDAPRGTIYMTDINGNHLPVAIEEDFPIIYAVPNVVVNPAAVAEQLAPILDVSSSVLYAHLDTGSTYSVLVKKGTDEMAQQVENLNIKGIYVDTEPGRYYPMGTLASQLLGYVGPTADGGTAGLYGVEAYYNAQLAGNPGTINGGTVTAPTPGSDVTLTIDPTIQKEAEQLLNTLVTNTQSPGGSIIVQDPKTGAILAMANNPQFDPNNYGEADISDFLNPVTQEQYEPGSVVKLVTIAAGLESGKITPETSYDDTGAVTIDGDTIHDWDLQAHGITTMVGVIEDSLNIGAAYAEAKTGPDIFRSYLKNFGFGAPTGIDLPGELEGDIDNIAQDDAPEIDFATASFGQGISATPLQVINMTSVFANGGLLMRPYVNAALKPQVIRRVIQPATAQLMTNIMTESVDYNVLAVVPGYNVAGKTGTAQLPNVNTPGYSQNVVDTYVGYAPSEDPKFVVLVKLNSPAGAPLAGETVVPAFQQMTQFLLSYYNVPPDRPTNVPKPVWGKLNYDYYGLPPYSSTNAN